MLELTGLGSLLRALGYLYWLLAAAVLVFTIYNGTNRRDKIIGAVIVISIFGILPGMVLVERYRHDANRKEAWTYFKKMCDERAGEKIYKTFTDVKSVLITKPLPPATDADHFDQFWFGDPYSASATSE